MIPRVTVLATLHVFQGAEKRPGNDHDPMYVALLNKLMTSEAVDFIFEEASGLGPTIAEKLAREKLAIEHYLDIDPAKGERHEFAIPSNSHEPNMIGTPPSGGVRELADSGRARQARNPLDQAHQQHQFESALMICGLVHLLSFAFRLQEAKFSVQAIDYANWLRKPIH